MIIKRVANRVMDQHQLSYYQGLTSLNTYTMNTDFIKTSTLTPIPGSLHL